jgi:hypothetical protein
VIAYTKEAGNQYVYPSACHRRNERRRAARQSGRDSTARVCTPGAQAADGAAAVERCRLFVVVRELRSGHLSWLGDGARCRDAESDRLLQRPRRTTAAPPSGTAARAQRPMIRATSSWCRPTEISTGTSRGSVRRIRSQAHVGAGLRWRTSSRRSTRCCLMRKILDLGSCGALLLPDEAGSAAHPHLLFTSGKEGRMYLLDRQALGGRASRNGLRRAGVAARLGDSRPTFGAAAYFDGSIYTLLPRIRRCWHFRWRRIAVLLAIGFDDE